MVNVFPNDVRCKHGHSRMAHPKCFIEGKPKPWWTVQDGKHVDMGFLDIETTGLDATFGTMLSWAVADYNTDKVNFMVTNKEHIQSEEEDKWLIEGLVEEALKYPVICTYYGTRFDIPFWRTRAEEKKVPFPAYGSIVHFDLYYQVRSKLKMGRNRLENVSRLLRLGDEKTHLDARIWRRAGQGESKSLKYVLDHNIVDVKLLKEAYKRLEYTFRGTQTSI